MSDTTVSSSSSNKEEDAEVSTTVTTSGVAGGGAGVGNSNEDSSLTATSNGSSGSGSGRSSCNGESDGDSSNSNDATPSANAAPAQQIQAPPASQVVLRPAILSPSKFGTSQPTPQIRMPTITITPSPSSGVTSTSNSMSFLRPSKLKVTPTPTPTIDVPPPTLGDTKEMPNQTAQPGLCFVPLSQNEMKLSNGETKSEDLKEQNSSNTASSSSSIVGAAETTAAAARGFTFGEKLDDRACNITAPPPTVELKDRKRKLDTSHSDDDDDQFMSSQPKVPALPEVKTMTGEENEVNVLQINCKLYSFDPVTHNWIERVSRGVLRLNDVDKSSSRLIVRTQATLRLMLNTKIFKDMNVTLVSPKNVRFTAMDLEESDSKEQDSDRPAVTSTEATTEPVGHSDITGAGSNNKAVKVFLVMGNPSEMESLCNALSYRIARL